ncbi:MAG: lamin tail domain-containing protein, partial [Candidatus Hydrogenedentes bacterium]|nr:lamin tail domain-containing protein [Candidatus Hydrogenedentota bacterium]
KYSIKYCPVEVNDPGNYLDDTFLEPSIVEDLENDPSLVNNDSVFQRIQNDWIGINARGEATGAVFLPGQLENPNLTPPPYYWLDGVLPEEQPIDPNNKTFAVLMPSYTPNDGRSDNDYVLCIAFWPEVIEQNQTVVLNYLDFSQEPDHEYIEITNISDKPINLSGYTVEIGIPRDIGGKRTDPYKVVGRIGANSDVVIAPKGKLLLTFDTSTELPGDKFDHYRDPDLTPSSIIKRNGIGVCRIRTEDILPPEIEFLRSITTPFVGLSEVENVFDREFIGGYIGDDFVDYNGDGIADNSDSTHPDNIISSTTQYPGLEPYIREPNAKPWDRIVALDSVEFPLIDGEYTRRVKMEEVNNLQTLARVILQGGLLPNYPERDGYDNDGDGGYLSSTSEGKYELGTLEKDGVDNNLDGVIDNTPLPQNLNDPMEILRRNEGVDEGRIGEYANGRVYGYGTYEKGFIPLFIMKDMNLDNGNVVVDFLGDPYDIQNPPNKTIGINSVLNPNFRAPYFGTDNDPPQWKAFIERRWNPGDCVVVCLYDMDGYLVDGVSYNEGDVINRSIDDVIIAPDELQLNSDFPSWWIPDCMLWDFYKSLNRKRPEYTGDRFGLSNRWEATDGYYDDWEESTSYLEHLVLILMGNESDSGFSLFNYTNNKPYRDKRDIDFVRNFFYGTPLGKSYTEIALESKDFSKPPNSLPDKLVINKRELSLFYPYWNSENIVNLGVLYSGSVGKIKLPIQRQFLMSYSKMDFPITGKYLFDLGRQNISFYVFAQDLFWRQVWTDGKVLSSQYQGNDEVSRVIRNSSNLLNTQSKVFTVGTAEFIPIRPNPSESDVFPPGVSLVDLLRFDVANSAYPRAWVPMFLFTLEGENYIYPRFANGFNSGVSLPILPVLFNTSPTGNWLFRNGAFGRVGISENDLVSRWEMQKRIFAYASFYPSAYPEQNRPEAVFIWDSEDGVENGDYAIYICVINNDQLNRLKYYDENLHSGGTPPPYELYSPFAKQWLGQDYDPTQIKLALEVITDPVQVRGLKPKGSSSDTGLTHPDDWFKTEIGGYQEDVTVYKPDRNGIIIYGQQAAALGLPKMVRITQKFVALRVRNVGDEMCYLTHIVLAPVNASPYKVNVNTFEPYIYTDGSVRRVHSAAMVLPGIHYPEVPLSKTGAFDSPPYGITPIPIPGYAYSNNPSDISLSTLHLRYCLAKNII